MIHESKVVGILKRAIEDRKNYHINSLKADGVIGYSMDERFMSTIQLCIELLGGYKLDVLSYDAFSHELKVPDYPAEDEKKEAIVDPNNNQTLKYDEAVG